MRELTPEEQEGYWKAVAEAEVVVDWPRQQKIEMEVDLLVELFLAREG